MRISDWSSDVCSSDLSIFESVISLLWHAFNKFNIDLALTKLRFDLIEQRLELASFNEVLDVSTSITYDQEEGRIYINGKEVRPSELLFIFDRNSYSEELNKFRLTEVVAESEETPATSPHTRPAEHTSEHQSTMRT